MPDRLAHVFIDLNGETHKVGQLWFRCVRGREGVSFEYDSSWLASRERFALEPALHLTEGVYHTGYDRSIFGAIGDSAPDRWG